MTGFCIYRFNATIPTCRLLCILLFLGVISDNAFSATYYSRTSGTFATPSTWSTSADGIPTNRTTLANRDIFIIQSTHTVTLGANRTIAQLTVNKGGRLVLAVFNLTVGGNWQNDGIIFGTTGSLIGSSGAFTNNGSINLTSGQLILRTGSLINSTTGNILFTGAGTIRFGTGNFINGNTSENVDFGSSAIVITGTAFSQNIDGFVTRGRVSCTKSSGRVTFTGDISMNGLTVNTSGGAVLDLGSGLQHTSSGTVVVLAGTLYNGSSNLKISTVIVATRPKASTESEPSSGVVNFYGSGNQTDPPAKFKH